MAIRDMQSAGLAVFLAALGVCLHGCGGGGGSCSAIEFSAGTVAKGVQNAAGDVTCKDGGEYTGPDLQCNWVGVACTAADKDGSKTCGIKYAFGVKGSGLDSWPVDKKPEMVDDAKQLSETKFTTDALGAEFAGKATETAGESVGKRMARLIAKGKKMAKAAKDKAAAAAEKLKEHASKAVDKAKDAVGKGDDAKGDDAKDDAKDEAKERRLGAAAAAKKGDDAKDDSKADAGPPVAIDEKKLTCSAPAKDDAKDGDAKSDAKDDAKGDGKDDAKGDGKDAEKLFSVSGQRMTKASADASSGWGMPLVGCLAVAGVAFAALKVARGRSARSRALDARQHDEESSQEAIE